MGALKYSDFTFKFVKDKSEDGEFFLEIVSADNKRRRICVIDIDEIEPIQGTKFNLKYYSRPTGYMSSFKKDKLVLKTETY